MRNRKQIEPTATKMLECETQFEWIDGYLVEDCRAYCASFLKRHYEGNYVCVAISACESLGLGDHQVMDNFSQDSRNVRSEAGISPEPTIILVGGPSACGKTRLAIGIADTLLNRFSMRSEIINADSMQIYNELKILTAYPTNDELSLVKHNLFGVLSPNEHSSVYLWLSKAETIINRLHLEKKVAIVCGGTGLYLNAIVNGISNIPYIPPNVRKNTLERFNRVGRDTFFDELSRIDDCSARTLHKNNTQRILRAYDVISFTGKPLSYWWEQPKKRGYGNVLSFVLQYEKNIMRERCYDRILRMIENGAIDEVVYFSRRYPSYEGPLRNVIGYCEILENIGYGINECKLIRDRIINLMYAHTKQYIKRQSTWFRNQMESSITLHCPDSEEKIAECIACFLTR
jgi:tRNA dimethylallyltransferase